MSEDTSLSDFIAKAVTEPVCPECNGWSPVWGAIVGKTIACPTCQGTGKAPKVDREKIAEIIRNYDVLHGHATNDCSYLSYLEVAGQIIALMEERLDGS